MELAEENTALLTHLQMTWQFKGTFQDEVESSAKSRIIYGFNFNF